jgi:hypothetical protein
MQLNGIKIEMVSRLAPNAAPFLIRLPGLYCIV